MAFQPIVSLRTTRIVGFVLRWAIPYSVELNDPTYVAYVVIVVLAWITTLVFRGAYDTRILGVGSEETLILIVAHNFRLKGVNTLLAAVGRLA